MKKKAAAPGIRIRVMIVDDHPVMRDGLRVLLEHQPDLKVVAEAECGPIALQEVVRANPDIVLMDGSMPQMSGAETTRALLKLHPSARVIGLTLYEQSPYLEEMLAAGARGYVLKTGAPDNLVNAVRTVAAGGTYYDSGLPKRTPPSAREPQPASALSGSAVLTAEEQNVARLLADGHSNTEIAVALGLSATVVESRKASAMAKLKVRGRAELVRVVHELGWSGSRP